MLTPLALFLGLLVATAFIAHWSDNLGKKLGKKRVSVFGLRPRTSATVLTVVSSWGIMMFTLLALLWTVRPLRQALLSIDAVRAELTDVTQQLTTSKEQLPVVQKRFELAQNRLKATEGKLKNANTQTAIAQKAVTVFRKDATKYQGEARNARSDAAKAHKDFETARVSEQNARSAEREANQAKVVALQTAQIAQSQAKNTRQNFQNASFQLNQKQKQLRYVQVNLRKTQTEAKNVQRQLSTSQKQLTNTKNNLLGTRKQLVGSYKSLAVSYKKVARAEADVAKKQAQVTGLNTQVTRLNAQAKSLQKDVNYLKVEAGQFGQLADTLASNNISLRLGQTLAERHIDANLSPARIEQELRNLLDSSQSAAQQLVPGVKVIARDIAPDPKSGSPVMLSENQTVHEYARLLASANQPVSARLVSAFNYPGNTGEVIASFVLVPVTTIYQAQQTIGEATIDTTKSESDIFGQLEDLIDLARFNAERQGANPPLLPNAPFFDGDTSQKMFDTWRKIQHLGRSVPVRIVAARDLDSTEPLQIRFQIGDASTT